MAKILIIGGSHRDIPLIEAYKRLGHETITIGALAYYIGHRYADRSYRLDFRDESVLQNIIEQEKIEYVVPGSGDLPMYLAAKYSPKGLFDPPETIAKINNKGEFKKLCQALGVHTPEGIVYNGDKKRPKITTFPVIVKPTNLSGGKGVHIARTACELDQAIRYAQMCAQQPDVVIETLLQSPLYAYSVILRHQKIVYRFLAQEFEKHFYVTTTLKTTLPPDLIDRLEQEIVRLAQGAKLVDGLLHIQFMIKDQHPYLLEATRRIPGDLFPWLIDRSDGVDYTSAVAQCYLGQSERIEPLLQPTTDRLLMRHCVVAPQDMVFERVTINPIITPLMQLCIYDHGAIVPKGATVAIIIAPFGRYNIEQLDQYIYPEGAPVG